MLKHLDETTPTGFRFELTGEEHAAGMVAFLTGPISGTVVVDDGTTYDVTEFAIPVPREHVGMLHVAIHKAHHAAGRFLDHPVPELADVSLVEE